MKRILLLKQNRYQWLISIFSISITLYFTNQNAELGYFSAAIFGLLAIFITYDYALRILHRYKKAPISALANILITLIPASYLFLFLNQNTKYYTFNVDYRYFLSITNTIIRYGDLSNSLEYDSAPIQYHAAPSVISAFLFKSIFLNPQLFFYILVPVIANMSLTLFVIKIQKTFFKKLYGSELLVSALILTFSPVNNISSTLHFETGLFNYSVMPNTIIGLTIILMSFHINQKTTRFKYQLITFSLIEISLLTIKPQLIPIYAVVFSLILMLSLPWNYTLLRKICLIGFTSITILLIKDEIKIGTAVTPISIKFDYSSINFLSILRDFPMIFLVFAGCVLTFGLTTEKKSRCMYYASLGIPTVLIVIKVLLNFTVFQIDDKTSNLQRIYSSEVSWSDVDFDQGLVLLAIFGMAVGLIQIVSAIQAKYPKVWKSQRINSTLSLLILIVSIIPTATFIHDPKTGYESYDGKLQVDALNEIPKFNGLVQVNDISDPAENYRRAGLGSYWSSFSTHQFYFSSFKYGYYREEDVFDRISTSASLFSKIHPLSAMKVLGINYLLINRRCEPAFNGIFKPKYQNEAFSVYSIDDFSQQRFSGKSKANSVSQKKFYGESRCL